MNLARVAEVVGLGPPLFKNQKYFKLIDHWCPSKTEFWFAEIDLWLK